jgi:hypothetical protein
MITGDDGTATFNCVFDAGTNGCGGSVLVNATDGALSASPATVNVVAAQDGCD